MINPGMAAIPASPDSCYYYYVSLNRVLLDGTSGFDESMYITRTPVITADDIDKMKKAMRKPGECRHTIISITLLAAPRNA